MQVIRREIFYNRMNEDYSSRRLDIEAMGLGRRGYSTTGYLQLYQRIGRQFHPDVVVVLLFVSIDLEGDYFPFAIRRGYAPLHFLQQDGRLVGYRERVKSINFPPAPPVSRAARFSDLLPGVKFLLSRAATNHYRVYRVARALRMIDEMPGREHLSPHTDVWLTPAPQYVKAAIEHSARADGARLVVMLPPGIEHAIPGWFESRRANYPASAGNAYDLGRVNRLLAGKLEDRGVECLDLLPLLRERIAHGEEVYWPIDAHLSRSGHSVLAQIAHDYLGSELGYLPE